MSDLSALLDDPDAIVGASGAGKSYTGRAKVEQLLERGRQTIIFDPTGVWYGLQSSASGTGPGFNVPVFGGPRANVPIRPEQGTAVADILLGERASAVIDLSQFEEFELRRFALEFLNPLRHRDRVNLHLVFDEAEEFAPQTAPDDIGFQLVRQMTWVAKRGRVFGLVPTFITQRPADFAKAVLSQVQTLYFHQLIAPADQKPVIDYLKANADKATLDQVRGSLPELGRGERWVYSPRRKLLELGVTAPIATFDSMVTPAPGQEKAEPRGRSQLDVSKIRAALVASAPSDNVPADPREAFAAGTAVGDALKERDDRILSLESENAELAQLNRTLRVQRDLFIYNNQLIRGLAFVSSADLNRAGSSPMALPIEEVAKVYRSLEAHPDFKGSRAKLGAEATSPGLNGDVVEPGSRPAGGRSPAATSELMGVTAGETAPKRRPREGPHPLAEKLAARMQAMAPARLTWRQLASIEGYKPDGGYFRAARRDALDRGAIVEDGDYVQAPGARGKGLTREKAFDLWHSVLPQPAPRIMETLRTEGVMFNGRLAGALGYSVDGGFFRRGLSLLRQNGVIVEIGRNDVQLAEPLPGESK